MNDASGPANPRRPSAEPRRPAAGRAVALLALALLGGCGLPPFGAQAPSPPAEAAADSQPGASEDVASAKTGDASAEPARNTTPEPARDTAAAPATAAGASAGAPSTRASPARSQDNDSHTATTEPAIDTPQLDLIRRFMAQDRLYAALAHIQEQQRRFDADPELELLRADVLRRLGDTATAARIYTRLRDGPVAAWAYHGLGLIAVHDAVGEAPNDTAVDRRPRDPDAGIADFAKAVELAPTQAALRNDLGYALMRTGRLDAAARQLATAYELDEANELNRNNYILLLLLRGEQDQAEALAADNGLGASAMAELEARAHALAGAPAPTAPTYGAPPDPSSPPGAPAIGGGGG